MLCLDTATGLTSRNATKMEGVKEWNTKSINDAIYSIGGIMVLSLVCILLCCVVS